MRPTEFTDEQIIQAGRDLQAAGRNITGFALRQKVGGGTPQRLKQVWDEHQSSQAATVAEPVAELPVGVAEVVAGVSRALTERIAELAVDLNDKAVKAAERKVHEVVRSAGEQRAQAERELMDASETVDDLETKLDESQTAADALASKLASVQEVHQEQAVELAQVRERLALTEKSAKAAGEQHVAELARMNATIQTDRARHQAEADQARAELDRARQAEAGTHSECAQLRLETLAAKTELANVTAMAKAADLAHQEQRKHAAKAEADRDTARQQASAAREEAAKLAGKLDALQTQVTSLMEALIARPEADKSATKTVKEL